ncbi:MAG: hypothetical protein HOJ48_05010 [Desulfobacula sp.]|jgi:hypothetical protein|nr:hypothetical protein [Desulfobacula sp.]
MKSHTAITVLAFWGLIICLSSKGYCQKSLESEFIIARENHVDLLKIVELEAIKSRVLYHVDLRNKALTKFQQTSDSRFKDYWLMEIIKQDANRILLQISLLQYLEPRVFSISESKAKTNEKIKPKELQQLIIFNNHFKKVSRGDNSTQTDQTLKLLLDASKESSEVNSIDRRIAIEKTKQLDQIARQYMNLRLYLNRCKTRS